MTKLQYHFIIQHYTDIMSTVPHRFYFQKSPLHQPKDAWRVIGNGGDGEFYVISDWFNTREEAQSLINNKREYIKKLVLQYPNRYSI